MAKRVICDLCGQAIAPHGHYIVRIDVYADPSMPPLSTEEAQGADFDKTLRELLEEMKHLSADDLQDQVFRRLEFKLCRGCQAQFLSNPLGKPRRRVTGMN
jgi:hypothetical protein